MIGAVKSAVARFLPGASLEAAASDLAHAKAELAAAEQAFAEEGSSSKWKAVKEAEDLVRQARLLHAAATKRAEIEAAKRAEAERTKLAEQREALLATLDEDRRRKMLASALETIRAAVFQIVDALDQIDAGDRAAEATGRDLNALEQRLAMPCSPAPRAIRPFVRGELRRTLENELRERENAGLTGPVFRDAAALIGVI